MEEHKKQFNVIFNSNLRSIINQANFLEIKKEDIIGIYSKGELWYLIYYI
jgi:hypothetical protein